MKEKIQKWLLDILNSISSIEEYLGEEQNFHKYESDKMFEVIRKNENNH